MSLDLCYLGTNRNFLFVNAVTFVVVVRIRKTVTTAQAQEPRTSPSNSVAQAVRIFVFGKLQKTEPSPGSLMGNVN